MFKKPSDLGILALVSIVVVLFSVSIGTALFHAAVLKPIEEKIANTTDETEQTRLVEERNGKVIFPYSILIGKINKGR
jgi:hypothetical protein